MRSDPFRDEVAIDFPSIDPFVERVRDGFLSETDPARLDALKVAVQISSRQAYRGTIVPIGVPVRATCASCGGRGETWAERCPACDGSGNSCESPVLRVPVPPGIVSGARLYFRLRTSDAPSLRIEVTVVVSEALSRFRDLST